MTKTEGHRTTLFAALVVVCAAAQMAAAQGTPAGGASASAARSVPTAGTRVDWDFRPDPKGQFVVRENWVNGPGTGFAKFNTGRKSPYSNAWEEPLFPDPTVLVMDGWYYVTGTGGGVLRRTGVTSVAIHAPDPFGANFMIWRTRDFETFEPFKWAFDDRPRGPGRRVNELPAGSGRWFARLQAPQLVRNPSDPDSIYLVFHGVEEAWVPKAEPARWEDPALWRSDDPRDYRNTLYPDPNVAANIDWRNVSTEASRGRTYNNPWDLNLPRYSMFANYAPERYSACFVVRTNRATFLDTGRADVAAEQRPAAFAGASPAWFSYADPATGKDMFDGGRSIGKTVPVSGSFALANPRRHPGLGLTSIGESPAFARWGNAPWVFGDAFVFFDPRSNNRPWLFYTWNDGRSACDGVPDARWLGNHIAYHPMQAGVGSMHRLDPAGTTRPLAFPQHTPSDKRDAVWAYPAVVRWPGGANGASVASATYMRLAAQANGVIGVQPVWKPEDGGKPHLGCDAPVAPSGKQSLYSAPTSNGWGVAEGPAVFYNRGTGRYYAIYARNMWNSSAYQLVYRMAPTIAQLGYGVHWPTDVDLDGNGKPDPGSVSNPMWDPRSAGATAAEEHVLLVTERPDESLGRSFGHADVFTAPHPGGAAPLVYLVYQFKEDGNNYRHACVKELRFDRTTGRIEPLFDDRDRDGVLERNDGPGGDAGGARTAVGYDARADARVFVWPISTGGGAATGLRDMQQPR